MTFEARLAGLCRALGGDVRALSADEFHLRSITDGFSMAPFTNENLGIDWYDKQIFYLRGAPPSITALVHEAAHIFACIWPPDDDELNELSFLGWEIACIRHLGYPFERWLASMENYCVSSAVLTSTDRFSLDMGELEGNVLAFYLQERLDAAVCSDLVSWRGEPLAIR